MQVTIVDREVDRYRINNKVPLADSQHTAWGPAGRKGWMHCSYISSSY